MRRKRTIDCTSSGSLLVTGKGGKSEVMMTRNLVG
jgi:ribosomal protein S27E